VFYVTRLEDYLI